MTQIFPPAINTVAKASIFGALFLVVGLLFLALVLDRSPYLSGQNVVRDQPVPFSHKHHVQELGIDCRYCHTSVEDSAFAGIPPTRTCMTCHSQIWVDSPALEPVRESFRTGMPVAWTRVHDLPDFVYFDHSIHVAKGIGCASCHGRVDEMNLMWKDQTLHMEWCLECHREPEKHIRPRAEIFNMDWHPPIDQEQLGAELVQEYQVHGRVDCSACHR